MNIQKDYFKMLEKMAELSQNSLDSFARLTEAATVTSENLLRQQLEMFQLASGPNADPMQGIAEISEIVFRKREQLTQQQMDMLKLAIESSTEFLNDNGDAKLEDVMKAQREFAEGLSNKLIDNVKNNVDMCFETQSEINEVMSRTLSTKQPRPAQKTSGEKKQPTIRKKRRYPATRK